MTFGETFKNKKEAILLVISIFEKYFSVSRVMKIQGLYMHIRMCFGFDTRCVSQSKIETSLELSLKFDYPYYLKEMFKSGRIPFQLRTVSL